MEPFSPRRSHHPTPEQQEQYIEDLERNACATPPKFRAEGEEEQKELEDQPVMKCMCRSSCTRNTKIIIGSVTALVSAVATTIVIIAKYY